MNKDMLLRNRVKKPVPEHLRSQPLMDIVTRIINEKHQELKEKCSGFEKVIADDDQTFAAMALEIFELNKTLDRHQNELLEKDLKRVFDELRINRNRLEKALKVAGVTILDLTGRELDSSLLESVEVIGWVKHDLESEVVFETYAPLVKRKDKVLHVAKVIGASKSAV